MPGPPPNPNARRTNNRERWLGLPASGREGEPPEWPLKKPTVAVARLWGDLWSTPQAVAWERMGGGTVRAVARYALLLVEAEKKDTSGVVLQEVRQLEDRLGLTPVAMRRCYWFIEDDQAEEVESPAGVADLDEFRNRFAG